MFREAFKTAAYLDSSGITTVRTKKATQHEHFYGSNPKCMKFLRTWWEVETVEVKTDMMPSIADRDILYVFVGYEDYHDGDVYRMSSPKMERVHITSEIIWMKQMMFTKNRTRLW
jgi:hypothetical protein